MYVSTDDLDTVLHNIHGQGDISAYRWGGDHVYDQTDYAHSERDHLQSFLCEIPIEFMIENKVDPRIVGYLYKRWYSPPLNEVEMVVDSIVLKGDVETYTDGLKKILEEQYTYVYYTSSKLEEDVRLLDTYAQVCGVTYEKNAPYGVRTRDRRT